MIHAGRIGNINETTAGGFQLGDIALFLSGIALKIFARRKLCRIYENAGDHFRGIRAGQLDER